MSEQASEPIVTRTLAAYLEGALTPTQREHIEIELARSEEVRARLAELRQLRAHLAAPLAEEHGFDVSAKLADALASEVRASSSPRPARVARYVAMFAACALSALLYDQHREEPVEREFRSKAAATTGDAQRWSGIHVFRARDGQDPELVEDRLSPGDGLLFTYRNEGRTPYRHLMIFARDAAGEVRWFYPAYERADADPASIPIAATSGDSPLPALIHQHPAVGPLTIYALFTHQAVRASAVEAWLKLSPPPAPASLAPGGRLQVLAATVTP